MPKLPFPMYQLRAAILNFLLIPLLFFKSIVKNEFLIPKYSRIEILVIIVAPQDQFYIETNSAICSFTQFAQYAHNKNYPNLLQRQQSLSCLFTHPEYSSIKKTL